MRVISLESGRVTLLFPFEETVPLGGVDGPVVVNAITEKYNFARPPDLSVPREELNKNGIKFENGRIDFEGGRVNIGSFTVYSDGIVVEANTTERASAFLDELIPWLRSKFGFRDFTTPTKQYFLSQIVVEFDRPIAKLISGYEKMATAINSELSQIYGQIQGPMDFARLDFEFDRATTGLQTPIPRFILERRAGVSFAQERYFAGAPMQTSRHIAVLESIENLVP